MKNFVIWLAVCGFTSALPQKREVQTSIESDIRKIIPKLPQNIKKIIFPSSIDNGSEAHFDVINNTSDITEPTYIIGNKNKQRYRVKIRKKVRVGGDQNIVNEDLKNTFRQYDGQNSNHRNGVDRNNYTYLRLGENDSLQYNNIKDASTNSMYYEHSNENEYNNMKSADMNKKSFTFANDDESSAYNHNNGAGKSNINYQHDDESSERSNVKGANQNEKQNVYSSENDSSDKKIQYNNTKFNPKGKIRITTHRTTYTKRKNHHHNIDHGDESPAYDQDFILKIGKFLNIKPEDVWLLGNKYLGLDIYKPSDMIILEKLYKSFVGHVKSNPDDLGDISPLKKYFKNISSEATPININQPGINNKNQEVTEPGEKTIKNNYSLPKYSYQDVPQYSEIITERVYKPEGPKQRKTTDEDYVIYSEKVIKSMPEGPSQHSSETYPKNVGNVTSNEYIYDPEDLTRLKDNYTNYANYLSSKTKDDSAIPSFHEWLDKKVPHISQNNASILNTVTTEYKIFSKPEDHTQLKDRYMHYVNDFKSDSGNYSHILPFEEWLNSNLQDSNENDLKIVSKVTSENYIYDPEDLNKLKDIYATFVKDLRNKTKNDSEIPSFEEWLNSNVPHFNQKDNRKVANVTTEYIFNPEDLTRLKSIYTNYVYDFRKNSEDEVPSFEEWLKTNSQRNKNNLQTSIEVTSDNISDLEDLDALNRLYEGYLSHIKKNSDREQKYPSFKDWVNTNSRYVHLNNPQSVGKEDNSESELNIKKLKAHNLKEHQLNYKQTASNEDKKIKLKKISTNEERDDSAEFRKMNLDDDVESVSRTVPDVLLSDRLKSESVKTDESIKNVPSDYKVTEKSIFYLDPNQKSTKIDTKSNDHVNKNKPPNVMYYSDESIEKASPEESSAETIKEVENSENSIENNIENKSIEKESKWNNHINISEEDRSREDKNRKYSDENKFTESEFKEDVPYSKKSSKLNEANDGHILDTDEYYTDAEPQKQTEIWRDGKDSLPLKKIHDGNKLIMIPNRKRPNKFGINENLYDSSITEDVNFDSYQDVRDKKQKQYDYTTKFQEFENFDDANVNQLLDQHIPIIIRKVIQLNPDKNRHQIYGEVLFKLAKMFPRYKQLIDKNISHLHDDIDSQERTFLSPIVPYLNPNKKSNGKNMSQTWDLTVLDNTDYGQPESKKTKTVLDTLTNPELQIPRPNKDFQFDKPIPQPKNYTTVEEFVNLFTTEKLIKGQNIPNTVNEPIIPNKSKIEEDTPKTDELDISWANKTPRIQGKNIKNENKYIVLLLNLKGKNFKKSPLYEYEKLVNKGFSINDDNFFKYYDENEKPSKVQLENYEDEHLQKLRNKMPEVSEQEITYWSDKPSGKYLDTAEFLLDIPKPDFVNYFQELANDILSDTSMRIANYLSAAGVPMVNIKYLINRINSEMVTQFSIGSTKCPSDDLNLFVKMLKLKIRQYLLEKSGPDDKKYLIHPTL